MSDSQIMWPVTNLQNDNFLCIFEVAVILIRNRHSQLKKTKTNMVGTKESYWM